MGHTSVAKSRHSYLKSKSANYLNNDPCDFFTLNKYLFHHPFVLSCRGLCKRRNGTRNGAERHGTEQNASERNSISDKYFPGCFSRIIEDNPKQKTQTQNKQKKNHKLNNLEHAGCQITSQIHNKDGACERLSVAALCLP